MKIVIFCGGYGTRLWPVSRKSTPKPFIPLIKGESFFQITYTRYRKMFKPDDIFVSTESKHLQYIKKQAPDLTRANIILEPERKDTLGACALAAAVINKYYPGETMLVSWAKHFISKESVFLNAIVAAAEYAEKTGTVVAIDSKPAYPSEHNGWIKLGKTLAISDGFKIVVQEKHVEKPAQYLANKFFKSGGWLIHTGYKVWKADVMLKYIKEFHPSMYDGLEKIAQVWGTDNQQAVLKREYHNFEKTSIDYGLLEKMPRSAVATIAADMGWEDCGISWEWFYKSLITPKQKTIIEGGADVELVDAKENLIFGSKGKMIVIIGLSNIAVIDTSDGLLVCRLEDTEKVKDVYKKLERYHKEYTL